MELNKFLDKIQEFRVFPSFSYFLNQFSPFLSVSQRLHTLVISAIQYINLSVMQN